MLHHATCPPLDKLNYVIKRQKRYPFFYYRKGHKQHKKQKNKKNTLLEFSIIDEEITDQSGKYKQLLNKKPNQKQ